MSRFHVSFEIELPLVTTTITAIAIGALLAGFVPIFTYGTLLLLLVLSLEIRLFKPKLPSSTPSSSNMDTCVVTVICGGCPWR